MRFFLVIGMQVIDSDDAGFGMVQDLGDGEAIDTKSTHMSCSRTPEVMEVR